jgi:hypothetical protein
VTRVPEYMRSARTLKKYADLRDKVLFRVRLKSRVESTVHGAPFV